MALTKKQAYALYFLLVSESSLIQNLRAANCADSGAFVAAVQQQVDQLQPGTVVDDQLRNLYSGNDVNGSTLIDQNAVSVLNSLPSLAAAYGGGACPTVTEQAGVWNALTAVA